MTSSRHRDRLPARDEPQTTASTGSPGVVKDALLAGGGFASAVTATLLITGQWQVNDGLARDALVAICVIAALTFGFAAVVRR